MLCLMICNMTPIPLHQHIAPWLLPGDSPFPPRSALVLTPVANGAAVKAAPVATIKHLTALGNICGHLPVLREEQRDFLSQTRPPRLKKRCSYLSATNQSQRGAKALRLKSDRNGVKRTCGHMRQRRRSALIECHSPSDVLSLLMKVKSN